MSIKQMTSVFNDSSLKPTQKLIMLAIADNSNDEGFCYPSIKTICEKTSLSKPTVINNLKELEADEKIISQKRTRKNGTATSKIYVIYPNQNMQILDEDVREKFKQSKAPLLTPQSKAPLPPKGGQSKAPLPLEPSLSLFNHHLFIKLNPTSKELYLEYVELRKKMKLVTSLKVHDRLLSKFFEFGEDNTVIENAINSNWRDFYKPKQQSKINTNNDDEWSDGAIRCDPNEYR